jgi:hypothetical protein
METQLKACMEACFACATACEVCATACLHESDVQSMTACILTDRDCADICRLTGTLLARSSQHGKHLIRECMEVCKACAAECEKHAKHFEHCRLCAEACRACAKACEAAL